MPGSPLLWRLVVLLSIVAGITVLAIQRHHPELWPTAEVVERVDSAVSTAEPLRHGDRQTKLPQADRTLPPLNPNLFGNVIVAPAVPTITPPPPPPAKPVAPPLPYTYLGQYRDVDGTIAIYLRRDDKVIVTKPGTQLDERYRLEAEISNGLIFTFVPLMEAQVIPIGNPAP